MADTELTLPQTPWRNTTVQIFARGEGPVVPGAASAAPGGSGAPARAIAVTDEGSLSIDVTESGTAGLVTGVEGDDNAIAWTAQSAGPDGNGITVALVDPGSHSASLSVDAAGTDITVSLATDSGGAITSTADAVKTAVGADSPGADDLVAVDDSGASDGSGVVEAVAKTWLTGGADTLATGRYQAFGIGDDSHYVTFKVQ